MFPWYGLWRKGTWAWPSPAKAINLYICVTINPSTGQFPHALINLLASPLLLINLFLPAWWRDRWHEETPSVCSALGNPIGRPRRALHITGGLQLPAWPRVGRPAGQGWHARLTRGESGVCIMWAADNYKLASFTHRPVQLTNGSVGWTWGAAAFLFSSFYFSFCVCVCQLWQRPWLVGGMRRTCTDTRHSGHWVQVFRHSSIWVVSSSLYFPIW